MDWGWSAIWLVATLLTLRFAWRTPACKIAWALVANVVFSNILGLWVPAEGTALVNTFAEMGVFIVCVAMTIRCFGISIATAVCSILSMSAGVAYSGHADVALINRYEEITNTILGVQCLIVGNVGLWSVVVDRVNRFFRWRAMRRPALNARRRVRLAPRRRG